MIPDGYIKNGTVYIIYVNKHIFFSVEGIEKAKECIDLLAKKYIEGLKKPDYRVTRSDEDHRIIIYTQTLNVAYGMCDGFINQKYIIKYVAIPMLNKAI